MDNQFIPKGMDIIRQAVTADNNDQLEEALTLYRQGLDYFMTGLKYVKNEKSKATIKARVVQYMERAEQIKEAIDKRAQPAKKKKKKVIGGRKGEAKRNKAKKKSSNNPGEDDGEEEEDDEEEEVDEETKRLQNALSGAIVTDLNVKWSDVAGLEAAKGLLQEAVILPVKFPVLFTGKRKPWRGILLYGPPGTGKSYLAKAVATEAGASCFLSVSSSDLVSKFQGESERLVKNLFELARHNAPSIIFIDEIDSLVSARGDGENESGRRIKTEFLVQMQGVGNGNDGVLVLGATNTPWQLDPAIRRRFEKRVYIPLPDLKARETIFKIHIGDTPNNLKPRDFRALAERTAGFSGSDIGSMVRDALYGPVRTCQTATHFKKVRDPEGKVDYQWQPCSPGHPGAKEMQLMDIESGYLKPVELGVRHFVSALQQTKSSVGPEDLTRLEEWTAQFGQEGS